MSLFYSKNKVLTGSYRNLLIEIESKASLKKLELITRMDHIFHQVVINVIGNKSKYEFRYNPNTRQLVANDNLAIDSKRQPLRFQSMASVAHYVDFFVNKEENPTPLEY